MIKVTPEALRLIARDDLGTPTAVYLPNTIGSIIFSLIFVAFGVVIVWVGFSLTSSSVLLPDQALSHILSPSPSFSSDLPDTFPPDPSSSPTFTLLWIVFVLIGLLFVVFSLRVSLGAILNRHIRAVVCTNGVAYVMRKSADTFRWEQVLTTFNKISVSTSTTSDQHSGARSSVSVHRTYIVHCHDGRKFVFDSTLSNVEGLAEDIEVKIARWRATS